MYVNAIELVDKFTRPIHIISRSYNGVVNSGTSTIFFVNEMGVAITCKHVLELITRADELNSQYNLFKAERDKLPRDGKFKRNLLSLESKYKLKHDTIIQIKIQFVNSVDNFDNLKWYMHPTLDLAILIFEGYKQILYTSFATFVKDTNIVKQGRSLCRLGYPFPEFTNFLYNHLSDDIEWIDDGNPISPRFPLDGIITRFICDENKNISIEMSTPGLRGQSGGPLFDSEGLIYGMQFKTSHLPLDFDVFNYDVIRIGKKDKIVNNQFLHVGQCIHVDSIKIFLVQNNIKFYEI